MDKYLFDYVPILVTVVSSGQQCHESQEPNIRSTTNLVCFIFKTLKFKVFRDQRLRYHITFFSLKWISYFVRGRATIKWLKDQSRVQMATELSHWICSCLNVKKIRQSKMVKMVKWCNKSLVSSVMEDLSLYSKLFRVCTTSERTKKGKKNVFFSISLNLSTGHTA